MTPFDYARAGDVAEAVRLGERPATAFLGGGTNLVDLMRETVARPSTSSEPTDCRAARSQVRCWRKTGSQRRMRSNRV